MYVGSSINNAAPPDLDSENILLCGAAKHYAAPPDLDLENKRNMLFPSYKSVKRTNLPVQGLSLSTSQHKRLLY